MSPRATGPVTIDRFGNCTECRVPMVRSGAFLDCEKCGRTVHLDEVRA